MLITCKCLNITLQASEADNMKAGVESSKPSSEELENLFKENTKEVSLVKVTVLIPSLISRRTIGTWMVENCLNCSVNCYATNRNDTTILINASLITTWDAIIHMKNHKNFSPVFRIIIQPTAESKGVDGSSIRQTSEELQGVLNTLQQKLRDSIQEEVSKTEERIRSFTEQQYVQLEEFRSRATRDHKALAGKIYEVQVPFENQELTISSNPEMQPPRVEQIETSLSRRLLNPRKSSPILAAVAPGSEFKGRPIPPRPITSYSSVSEKMAGSLDSEGLFVIEGMEDQMTNEPAHSEGESDTDHEDSGSHDEGIDVHRKRASSCQLAKSLPVNVPVYSITPSLLDHDDEPSDTIDIAASIKALARSVHGDTVFGDLPRPRFSTQI